MSNASYPHVITHWPRPSNARDLEALNAVFTDDIVMEWPQSGERIRGEKPPRDLLAVSLPAYGDTWPDHGNRRRLGARGEPGLRRRRPIPVRLRLSHSRRAHCARDGVLDQAVPRARLARPVGRAYVSRR